MKNKEVLNVNSGGQHTLFLVSETEIVREAEIEQKQQPAAAAVNGTTETIENGKTAASKPVKKAAAKKKWLMFKQKTSGADADRRSGMDLFKEKNLFWYRTTRTCFHIESCSLNFVFNKWFFLCSNNKFCLIDNVGYLLWLGGNFSIFIISNFQNSNNLF